MLDPAVAMLNHGSFGACPRAVLQRQRALRDQMEQEPVRFFTRQMQPLLDESRQTLAGLVGVDPADLVFVRNATAGVNSVLRSLRLEPDDEILVTDHGYNACYNAVDFVARRAEAKVVTASLPLPIQSAGQVVESIVACVTDRTRLAVLDHITSPTGVVFPIAELVGELAKRRVDTLVDGAHGPGMVPLDLARIGAAYYAGNCHKWLCAPKGAAFLHVRPDRQPGVQPVVISHGFNTPRKGYNRFQDAFDFNGTDDPTPWLCVAEAIRFLDGLIDGGLEALMRRNRELALSGRRLLCGALGLVPCCSESMVGSLAALRLPDDAEFPPALDTQTTPTATHPLQTALLEQWGIEVPVYHWPSAPQRLLRISSQAYNSEAQHEYLAATLGRMLPKA